MTSGHLERDAWGVPSTPIMPAVRLRCLSLSLPTRFTHATTAPAADNSVPTGTGIEARLQASSRFRGSGG